MIEQGHGVILSRRNHDSSEWSGKQGISMPALELREENNTPLPKLDGNF